MVLGPAPPANPSPCPSRGDCGHLMLMENIVPQSEVIRAIVSEDSPWYWVPHLPRTPYGSGNIVFNLNYRAFFK